MMYRPRSIPRRSAAPIQRSSGTIRVWGFLSVLVLAAGLTTSPRLAMAEPPEARGWVHLRGVMHAHTPYSHDACDGDGLNEAGAPNAECLAQLRLGACASRLQFLFFTDHPDYMKYYPIEQLVLYDPSQGDRLLYGEKGILANEMSCQDGRTTWKVWIATGAEGDHNMPIGLESHLEDPALYSVGFEDEDDLAAGREAVAAIHAAGGLSTLAHAEAISISASKMVALGIDAVELYNAHANFDYLLIHNPLQLLEMDAWMGSDPGSPTNYDLVALVMLPYVSDAPLAKWDETLAQTRMTGFIGTDVHQNVTLDPYCEPGSPLASLCARLKPFFPNLVGYLEVGGPLPLGDGERLDSYRRMFRWFSNHVLASSNDLAAVKTAVARGRTFAAYDVLGQPEGFDLTVRSESTGVVYEMGDSAPYGDDLRLWLTLPVVSSTDPFATWTAEEAAGARVRAEVIRVDADGVSVVARRDGAGKQLMVQIPGPGAYRVEVFIEPRHLASALGNERPLAYKTYRWLWSNPVYVVQ